MTEAISQAVEDKRPLVHAVVRTRATTASEVESAAVARELGPAGSPSRPAGGDLDSQ